MRIQCEIIGFSCKKGNRLFIFIIIDSLEKNKVRDREKENSKKIAFERKVNFWKEIQIPINNKRFSHETQAKSF